MGVFMRGLLIGFLTYVLIKFWNYYYAKWIRSLIWLVSIFFISLGTEILIESSFSLGMYVPCILKDAQHIPFQLIMKFDEDFKYFPMW